MTYLIISNLIKIIYVTFTKRHISIIFETETYVSLAIIFDPMAACTDISNICLIEISDDFLDEFKAHEEVWELKKIISWTKLPVYDFLQFLDQLTSNTICFWVMNNGCHCVYWLSIQENIEFHQIRCLITVIAPHRVMNNDNASGYKEREKDGGTHSESS